ncbi:hypothetical protein NE237_029139 [Protea cynaroides]|uniref:Uncharacterized protein n=1 Tax=Protea cynaroides TaxID=273540 RepID=A0A9Q0JUT3_9MAGN|nr:hypothetical protein NE237_029139 [Protea cynaroides]
MGNCSNKGATERMSGDFVRIMTDSGGIMELEGPLHVRNVLDDFPGYGVFRRNQVSSPLFHHEQLLNGQSYYLLPLKKELASEVNTAARLSSVGTESDLGVSSASVGPTGSRPALEVLPSPGNGVWRVKLVIDTKQLGEILSEQVNTEALIEKMRSAASASSAAATPRRSKGRPWGLARKPVLYNVCKLPL